jgi:hypothetical protein
MALIVKADNVEKNFYKKILLDKCHANINGIYAVVVTFKNKEEREKDKSRIDAVQSFISNVEFKVEELRNMIDENLRVQQSSEFEPILKITTNFFFHIYKSIVEEDQRSEFSEEELTLAESYGFNREWVQNPVIVVKEEEIWLEEYNQQEFTLETFYSILKEKIYTDKNGYILVEDDL